MGQIGWGIMGCGGIAHSFVECLKTEGGGNVAAAGSRDIKKARDFLAARGCKEAVAYGSYEELLRDPGVEVIYVATPHHLHMKNTLMALEAGKHVLCEKPMGINSHQVQVMRDKARERGLFLMEGMWTATNALVRKAKKSMEDGLLGDVRRVTAVFAFPQEYNPSHRIFNPQMAGGALLDIGIYTLFYGQYFFGAPPEKLEVLFNAAPSGVDRETSILALYPGGRHGIYSFGFTSLSDNSVLLEGSRKVVRLQDLWYPRRLTYEDKSAFEVFEGPEKDYAPEAAEVHRCLLKGLTESPLWSLEDSLDMAKTLDRVREKIGLSYPGEKEG